MLMAGTLAVCLAFVFLKSMRLGILVLVVSYYTTAVALAVIPLGALMLFIQFIRRALFFYRGGNVSQVKAER